MMDIFTINQIAYIRQQEILREAAQNRGGVSFRKLLRPVGILLVGAGQRLLDTAQDVTQSTPHLATNETLDTCDQPC